MIDKAIRWLQRRFFKIWPDNQLATMIAHTLLTLVPAVAVELIARSVGFGPRLGWASVTAVFVAALYWRRERGQVRKSKARWSLYNYQDLIGPFTVALTFLVAWGLSW